MLLVTLFFALCFKLTWYTSGSYTTFTYTNNLYCLLNYCSNFLVVWNRDSYIKQIRLVFNPLKISSYISSLGFIQAMIIRRLNLLIEFSNSILIKCYFKAFQHWIFFKIHWLTRFLLFWAVYLLFRCKKVKIFQGLDLVKPQKGSAMKLLWSLQHLETLTCNLYIQS